VHFSFQVKQKPMPIPATSSVTGPAEAGYDALVVVVRSPEDCSYPEVAATAAVDSGAGAKVSVMAASGVAGGRLVLTPTGPLTRDFGEPLPRPGAVLARCHGGAGQAA